MTLRAPVAVELGWFLVSNSGSLPDAPTAVLEAYAEALRWDAGRWRFGETPDDFDGLVGDWEAQVDLTWIVGLLLRGWRKGLDAEAGATLASGASAPGMTSPGGVGPPWTQPSVASRPISLAARLVPDLPGWSDPVGHGSR